MKQVAYQNIILILLQEVFNERTSKNIYKYVLEEYFNNKFIHLNNTIFSDEELEDLNVIFEKITNHYPIQYIFRRAYFYGLDFFVNEQVLIPRPETEELVHLILKENDDTAKYILDIGTGSGCIPITLKKYRKNWTVSTMDISAEALEIAKTNAKNNQTDIHFIQENILTATDKIFQRYDIIVSNPPYITPKEKGLMTESTLKYEPELALFTPENEPLIFYKMIADFASKNLKQNGILYFELNEFYAQEVLNLFLQIHDFKQPELIKDMSGKYRILKVVRS